MHQLIKTTFALAIAGLLAPLSGAVSEGLNEIGFTGSYDHTEFDVGGGDIESDTINLTGTFGYFFTDAIEGVFSGTFSWLDADGSDDVTSVGFGTGVDYHFTPGEQVVPFVGVSVFWNEIDFGSEAEDEFSVQVRLGAKQFVAENIAIRYQAEYEKGDDLDNFGVSIGLSTFF